MIARCPTYMGQFKFNYNHPHIKDGRETQLLLQAFDRDFQRNGPSILRVARTGLRRLAAIQGPSRRPRPPPYRVGNAQPDDDLRGRGGRREAALSQCSGHVPQDVVPAARDNARVWVQGATVGCDRRALRLLENASRSTPARPPDGRGNRRHSTRRTTSIRKRAKMDKLTLSAALSLPRDALATVAAT